MPLTGSMIKTPSRTQVRGLRRGVYVVVGLFFVGLGVLGAFLPILPTTPFVLLASYFFVRSSPRLNAWLFRSRLLGRFLRDWHEHRGVRPRVKFVAIGLIVLVLGTSAAMTNLSIWLLVALLLLGLAGIVVVLLLPTIRLPRAAKATLPADQMAAGQSISTNCSNR
jgi:uncharacterized membrane protein YbaN (DUF454 family)